MSNPEMHGFTPEPPKQSPEKESAITAIRVQAAILGKLADDDSRTKWIERHAETFRQKFEQDADFRDMAEHGDLDGIEAALDNDIH